MPSPDPDRRLASEGGAMKDSEGAYTEGEGEGNAGRGNEAQIDKVARRETETRMRL